MEVEKLIVSLGFKVDLKGIDVFQTALDKVKSDGLGLAPIGDELKNFNFLLAEGAKKSAVFGAALKGLSGLNALRAGPIGIGIAALRELLGAAYGQIKPAMDAALTRRRIQLTSGGQGTTARNADKVTRLYRGIALNDGDASSRLDEFSSELKDAYIDTGKAPEWLEKLGIKTVDETTGRRRDSADIYKDAFLKAADKTEEVQNRRKNAADLNPKQLKQLEADERELQKLLTRRLRLSNAEEGALREQKGSAEIERKAQEAESRSPIPSENDETRTKRIAEDARKLRDAAETIQSPLEDLRAQIADRVLPGMVQFADGLVEAGKQVNLIDKTESDKAREAQALNGFIRTKASFTDQSLMEESARNLLKVAEQERWGKREAAVNAREELDKSRGHLVRGIGKAPPGEMEKRKQRYDAAFLDFLNKADELIKQKGDGELREKLNNLDFGALKTQGPNSDFNNDKRSFAIHVTVPAQQEAAVAVKQAISGIPSGAVSNNKAVNGWTGPGP